MLEIKNLKASVSETEEKILDGLNLTINKGETHAIMGPNGGGKSTLVNVIAGKDSYTVDSGKIGYFNEDLIEMEVDERAKKGIFMAFQYPSEIPGVRPWQFIKASVDAKRKFLGDKELSVREFSKLYDENIKIVGMNEDLMKRSLNEGFSGGEKKRNEVFQMLMLEPQLALLDETDSGLDVDALKSVGDVVNRMRNGDRSFLIVTHYQRLLDHIKPDFVHVLIKGKIVESGGYELV
ncbi:MAG: Fe-S cluster assembly ATPase SufC, partial [Chloroflexota bacterium]|nr:Fe-S cluster assembly ATPase SufC [Chloroflexota bacterium]